MSKTCWDIFLVFTWLVLQSTLLPMMHIQHDDLDPSNLNLQHVGGVLFGPAKGTNLNFLYFPHLSKKYDRLGYG
jgi:hypothetical protein